MIYIPREDSYLLEKQVKKHAKGKSVIDIGSGSGIQAKAAIKSGAKSVIATDINQEAINHLKSQKINAIKSNLFEKINKKTKFDLIIFNPPYLPKDKKEDKESQEATTGGKQGDETILRFLKQAKSHLYSKGIILIVISSLTPKDKIEKLLKKQNLQKQILSKESFFFEALEAWKITRSNRKQ